MKKAEKQQGTVTADAVLGLLSMRPMTGYGMRTVISQSIGHFWSESFGQIYPALKRLTAEGLIEKKTERPKGRPEQNLYFLTKTGRERLGEWLTVPPERGVPRNDLLLKLFFGAHVPVSVSRDNIKEFIARHELALREYDAIAKRLRRDAKENPQAPFWLMTVRYGQHYSEALVKWGRETMNALDGVERRSGKKRAGATKTKRK